MTKSAKHLYEQGLAIVETKNLYAIQRKVAKGKDDSFSSMMRQNIYPAVYINWWTEAEDYFSSDTLNFLRFKKKVFADTESSDYAVGHAGNLLTALEELEKMIEDDKYLESYKLSAKKVQNWPEVQYEDGIVRQGDKFHKFSSTSAVNMLNTLWPARQIMQPDKSVLIQGLPSAWVDFAKSTDNNKGTAQAINKAMREKGITLAVIYPKRINGLLLVAKQKRAN